MDEDTQTRRPEELEAIEGIDNDNRDVFAVIGPVGSGKSTVAEMIEDEHDEEVVVFEMSDFVRGAYVAEHKRDPDDDNSLGEWAAEQKAEHGDGYFGKALAETVHTSTTPHAVISGVRSPEEARAIKEEFGHVTTVAVWTLPELRFERRYGSEVSEDHPKWGEFQDRNEREKWTWGCVEFYAAESMYEADYIVPNNGDLNGLRRRVTTMLKHGHWGQNPFVEESIESVAPYV
jgi:dephospho-CoA kinase